MARRFSGVIALNGGGLLFGFLAGALVAAIAITATILLLAAALAGVFFCARSVTGSCFVTGRLYISLILFRFIRT